MAGEACMDVGSPTSWNLAIEFTAWEFIAPIYCLDIEEIKTTIQCRLWIPFDGREYLSRGEASLDVETIGAASWRKSHHPMQQNMVKCARSLQWSMGLFTWFPCPSHCYAFFLILTGKKEKGEWGGVSYLSSWHLITMYIYFWLTNLTPATVVCKTSDKKYACISPTC